MMSNPPQATPWPLHAANSQEFEAFYQQHLPRIYNFFRYRFADNALAEDLTSVTFEKAWKKRGQYRRDLAAFSTWLFTIARNVAVDAMRQTRPQLALEDTPEIPAAESLEEAVQHRHDLRRLDGLLRSLDARESELVALKYGADLNNREIARLTGLSESNVGVILFRTLENLREKWKDQNEG